jgi:hypothetical protein
MTMKPAYKDSLESIHKKMNIIELSAFQYCFRHKLDRKAWVDLCNVMDTTFAQYQKSLMRQYSRDKERIEKITEMIDNFE